MAKDITEAYPYVFSSAAATIAATYDEQNVLPDFTIGGMPFRLAVSKELPYTRKTFDFKRQQIDTSPEAGEQTLSSWWTRDETSWHRGAGILYYEPGSDKSTIYRYQESVGIDPWSQGEMRLHRKMDQLIEAGASDSCYATAAVVGGADVIFTNVGGTVSRHNGTTQTDYSSTPTPASPVEVAGASILVGSTSGILSGAANGNALTTLWSTGTSVLVRPWWAKSRIIAAQGPDLHDLSLAGGALGTALWTHPDTGWTWTAVAEAPDAILAAGRGSGVGAIYSFMLTDSGSSTTPELGAAIQVATLPPGEEIYSMATYLGTYIAVGTNRGIRIGTLASGAAIQLGPVTVATSAPVHDITARDTYFFGTVTNGLDGSSGAVRIDVSTEIPRPTNADVSLTYVPTLRYAYANDGSAEVAGTCESVAFLGVSDRMVVGVHGEGIYISSTTEYTSTGHITLGRIRFATAEPKSFRFVKLRSDTPGDSTIGITTISASNTENNVFTVGGAFNTNEDISLGALGTESQEFISLKFTLDASADSLSTPVIQDIQAKASPQPKLQREIQVPLRLDDREEDRNGQRVGYTGSAIERLLVLEAMEEESALVLVTDNTAGESFSAQIKSVQFARSAPPSRNTKNFGGILMVTLVKI